MTLSFNYKIITIKLVCLVGKYLTFVTKMHFIEPVSECSISVNILADGITCREYQPSGGDGNQQCWIAVEANQVLSVQCNVEMVARKYHVDLIVDGILRNSWISSRVEKIQKRASTIDFSKGIYKDIRSLFEGCLRTSSLRQRMPCLAQEKSRC